MSLSMLRKQLRVLETEVVDSPDDRAVVRSARKALKRFGRLRKRCLDELRAPSVAVHGGGSNIDDLIARSRVRLAEDPEGIRYAKLQVEHQKVKEDLEQALKMKKEQKITNDSLQYKVSAQTQRNDQLVDHNTHIMAHNERLFKENDVLKNQLEMAWVQLRGLSGSPLGVTGLEYKQCTDRKLHTAHVWCWSGEGPYFCGGNKLK